MQNSSLLKPATALSLTPCQQAAMQILESQVNVFVTGSAGSGKSFLIRRYLANKDPKEYPVLASTGAAAILVVGRTSIASSA